MEDLLLAVTSLKRDFQERKLTRLKQDQSGTYEYRLSLISPKLNSSQMSETKLPGPKTVQRVPLIRIPVKAQDEYSRYLQSTPHSASITKSSPARARSYKLDAAGLLMSRVKKFIAKHFALWRQNTDSLRNMETKMFGNRDLVFKVNIKTKTEKPRYVKGLSDEENWPKAQTTRLASRSPVVFDFDLERNGKQNFSLEVETPASPVPAGFNRNLVDLYGFADRTGRLERTERFDRVDRVERIDRPGLPARPASTKAGSAFKGKIGNGTTTRIDIAEYDEGKCKGNRLRAFSGSNQGNGKGRNGIWLLSKFANGLDKIVKSALEGVWGVLRRIEKKKPDSPCRGDLHSDRYGKVKRYGLEQGIYNGNHEDLNDNIERDDVVKGKVENRFSKIEKRVKEGVNVLNQVYVNHIRELFFFMKFRCVVESGFFEGSAIVESSQDNLKEYIESIEKNRKKEKSYSHKSISYMVNAPSFVNLMTEVEFSVLKKYFKVLVQRFDCSELAFCKLINVMKLKVFDVFQCILGFNRKKIEIQKRKIRKMFKYLNKCHNYLVDSCFAQWKFVDSLYDPVPLQIITLNDAVDQITRRYKRDLFQIYSLSKYQKFKNNSRPLQKSTRFRQGLNLLTRHLSYIKKKVFLKLSLPITSKPKPTKPTQVSFIYYQLLHKYHHSFQTWKSTASLRSSLRHLSLCSLSLLSKSLLHDNFSKLKL